MSISSAYFDGARLSEKAKKAREKKAQQRQFEASQKLLQEEAELKQRQAWLGHPYTQALVDELQTAVKKYHNEADSRAFGGNTAEDRIVLVSSIKAASFKLVIEQINNLKLREE